MSNGGSRRTAPQARLAGRRRATTVAIQLGEQIARARRRRRWTQVVLASKVGITQARHSQIETGRGTGVPLHVWFALAEALGVPLRIELGRDRLEEPPDAGHLKLQELVLRLAGRAGFRGTFELSSRPADPALSVDVALRDDRRRLMILVECWNTFGNMGASIRVTRRKVAELENLAVAVGGDRPFLVAACWVVRDTRRNRELIARYPETFGSTFLGSSSGWVKTLTEPGTLPPTELGLVWADTSATRLSRWRRPNRIAD